MSLAFIYLPCLGYPLRPNRSCLLHKMCILDRRTGNEEPLVNAWVNWSRGLVVAGWDVELAWIDTLWGVVDSGVGALRG